MPKWISVKDRLPEELDNVLVYADGLFVQSCLYEIMDKKHADFIIKGKLLRWSYYLGCRYKRVTHWMPLPEPPKD